MHIKLSSLHSLVKKILELQMVIYPFWHKHKRFYKMYLWAFAKFLYISFECIDLQP